VPDGERGAKGDTVWRQGAAGGRRNPSLFELLWEVPACVLIA
jgi:hypothetical protein